MKNTMRLFILFMLTGIFVKGVELSAYAADYYEYESNDSFETANTLKINNSISGCLGDFYDVDYFKIETSSNGKLSITFNHTYEDDNGAWSIEVYRYVNGEYQYISGSKVALRDSEKISVPYIGAEKNATYYIKVYGETGYGIIDKYNYSISSKFETSEYYEKEGNNSYRDATHINLNKKYQGIINVSEDNDFYKIETTSNGKLSITFNHTYEDEYGCWSIEVYRYINGEYQCISKRNVNLRDSEIISMPYIGAEKKGIYYIKVYDNYNESIIGRNYSITSNFKASEYYEKEKNDEYRTANLLKVNKTYSGNINDNYDYDFYKIIAPQNGKLSVVFNHDYCNGGLDAWEIRSYRYVNGEYIEIDNKKISANESKKEVILSTNTVKSGVYYIKVYQLWYDVKGINYTLTPSFTINKMTSLKMTTHSTSEIKLSWNKIANVDGYQLEIYKSGKWSRLCDSNVNSYTIRKLAGGTTYKFRIRIYDKIDGVTYYGNWCATKMFATKPGIPILNKVSTNNKHQILVEWKKIVNCRGYEIRFSKSKDFSKDVIVRNVSGSSTTRYTCSNMEKGKRYYVKMRSYISVNGKKYYSLWRDVKSIVVK